MGIEVHWEPRLCIHTRNCVRSLGAVLDPDRRPWVDPDAADPDAVAAAVTTCPTGALHFVRTDGGPQEDAGELTVTPRPRVRVLYTRAGASGSRTPRVG